jgi:hypothetical protein
LTAPAAINSTVGLSGRPDHRVANVGRCYGGFSVGVGPR